MRTLLSAAIGLAVGLTVSCAHADPLYSMTNLGPAISYQYAPNGGYESVASVASGTTYAFDKTPITVSIKDSSPDALSGISERVTFAAGGYHADNQYWSNNPTITSSVGWWSYQYLGSRSGPIEDINVHGQVVGTLDKSLSPFPGGVAMATLPGLQNHHSDQYNGGDYLNLLIPPQPSEFALIDAFAIDDSGRILVRGNDSNIYLLTPTEPGPPLTAPEPTSLMLFSLVAGAAALPTVRDRLIGRHKGTAKPRRGRERGTF